MESNNPQIRWKALPSSEKAYFKQLSDEDAKRVRLEQGLEDKENKAPAKKRSKKADKENDTPVMKRAKMEVLKEDTNTELDLLPQGIYPRENHDIHISLFRL